MILYEMLTGLPPFEGGNYFQLLWKHGNEPPQPMSERAPDLQVPAAVEDAIMKALRKDPDDRFATMAEFQAALSAFAPEDTPAHLVSMPSMPGRPPSKGFAVTTGEHDVAPSRSSRTGLILGGAALVLALVGVGIVAFSGDETTPPPVTDAETEPEPEPPELEELPEGLAPPGEGEGSEDPQMVSVTFDSQPEGATVSVGGEILGTTPIVAPIPLSDEPLEVTFSKDRHVDDVVSVVPTTGARVEGRLRPIRRRGGTMMSTGMSPAIKMSF